ncbi:MAG: translation initiation factor IF-2, partial [Bacteroidia bacterium]
EFKEKKLTFIDTPGHAAFNKMRERGAKVTDLIILVVAADDGVKPQTIESIRHIKAAGVPYVVAINKIDLPNTYPDVIKGELAQHDVLVVGFGGDVETIPLSAKTGEGVDTLLETIAVMAELNDYKADPTAPLKAVVIESSKDSQRGSLASVIVQQGTLKIRQDIYTDSAVGRIRALTNESGLSLMEVTPGSPAEIVGFSTVPAVGEIVYDAAAEYAQEEPEIEPESDETVEDGEEPVLDFDFLLEEREKLKLIIRADVTGTLEAITQTLDSESVEQMSAAVGPVTEQDIELAQTTGSVIIAFHQKVSNKIKNMAKESGVRIRSYDVIYHLIEDLQKQMLKLMEPTIDEVVTGEGEIIQIFEMKGDRIAGVRVKTGEIKKNDLLHLKRGEENVANPVVKLMMHGKEEIQSIKAKNEAGFTFRNRKLDFQVGDTIIAYHTEIDVDD